MPELARLNDEVKGGIEKLVIWGVVLQFCHVLAGAGMVGLESIQAVAKQIEASIEVNEATLNALRYNKAFIAKAFIASGRE